MDIINGCLGFENDLKDDGFRGFEVIEVNKFEEFINMVEDVVCMNK